VSFGLWVGGVAVTWVFVDPEPLAPAFDEGTSTWVIAVWVSSVFWLAVGVLAVLATLARRLASPSRNRMLRAAVGLVGVVLVLVLVAIPIGGSIQMRGLLDREGQIEIFKRRGASRRSAVSRKIGGLRRAFVVAGDRRGAGA